MRFTSLRNVWIDHSQQHIFTARGSRAHQARQRCGLAVAVIGKAGRGESSADGLRALVAGVEIENMANRGDDEAVFVSEIETVEAVDELGAIGHDHLVGVTVEYVERHRTEDGIA